MVRHMLNHSTDALFTATMLLSLAVSMGFAPVLASSSGPSFEYEWITKGTLARVRVKMGEKTSEFRVSIRVTQMVASLEVRGQTIERISIERIDPSSPTITPLALLLPDGSYIDVGRIPGFSPGTISSSVHFSVRASKIQDYLDLFIVLVGIAALFVDPLYIEVLQTFARFANQSIDAAKEDAASDRSWDIWVPLGKEQLGRLLDQWILIATTNWWWRIEEAAHEQLKPRGTAMVSTRLTLDVPPRIVKEGSTVMFTGRLAEADTGHPIVGAVIKIFDSDVIFDDLMAEGKTEQDGMFKILWVARPMDWWDKTVEVYARFVGSQTHSSSRAPATGYFTMQVSR